MATKYSDIIRIRPGKPAYNIEEEGEKDWESFIPNEQFNNVLKTVLRAVKGNDIDAHKSFWINGTYGTGKSHATAVIAHLLGDSVAEIRGWVDYEYGEPKFQLIKDNIYKVRAEKRLLMVRIKGLNSITHVSELAPLVQTKVVEALNWNDIEIEVDTDYDALIKHVSDNPVIWDDLIQRNISLSTIVADRNMLLTKLKGKDSATLQKARVALREANIMLVMQQEMLGDWLIEVQNQLREASDFTGMLILWDEFTEVMQDAVGIPVLNALQAVAEKFSNEENDSFIFLVSHPSAFNSLDKEAVKHTDGRYHRMKYNMESVSAFKIMSRKFEIVGKEQHTQRREFFYGTHEGLLDLYSQKSNDPQETKEDLFKLFPIHPGTANLATHYATTVGSSSRSVFEFIGDNDNMRNFLDSEDAFFNQDTITADFLWDFVLKEFNNDLTSYGAVIERYNACKNRVEHQGHAAEAVFKAILLLNAFNNMAEDESVTPSEDNVHHLFEGTRYEQEIDDALVWINDNGIIQRSPIGIYSVQFSALPSHELEEIKEKLYTHDYQYTSQILKFGDTAKSFFDKKYLQKVIRPYVFDFFSEGTNDSIVKNSIKTAKKDARPSDLNLILFYARNDEELGHLRQFAGQCSKEGVEGDNDLKDLVFLVVDTVFGDKNYDRFIEYMASYTAAGNHGFLDQANVHRDNAVEMVKEWMQAALRGNATICVNGQNSPISLRHLSSCLNDIITPSIFPMGPDALDALRHKAPTTFWKPQVSKEIIRNFIFSPTKTELLDVNAVMKPVQYIVQDALEEDLTWKAGIPAGHQFKAVYDFVNSTIKNFISHGNTTNLFDFTERFAELTKPPYGLSANYASAAMVAYALKPWANKIYDNLGKPRSADNLADDIVLLFKYWEGGKTTNKLSFKFQTPQEGKLCKELIKMFKLDKLEGYSDISSMKDARYAITGVFLEKMGYPLWSLKYMTEEFISAPSTIFMNDDVKQLIDNIVDICEEKDQKNVQLVISTLTLIENYRVDFREILFRNGAFENGFHHFLFQEPNVQLKEEELDGAKKFIKENLQSTVGYWSETEVIDTLRVWKIRQSQDSNGEGGNSGSGSNGGNNGGGTSGNGNGGDGGTNIPIKAAQAQSKLLGIDNPDKLRSIINKLIDLRIESVIDLILNEE